MDLPRMIQEAVSQSMLFHMQQLDLSSARKEPDSQQENMGSQGQDPWSRPKSNNSGGGPKRAAAAG